MFGRSSLAVVLGTGVALMVGASSRPAFAIKEFFDEFKAVYVKPDSSDANEKALAAEVETAKCNVCHAGSNKKEDKKDTAKIRGALEKVAAMPSGDGKPTFGELIKQGKLPGAAN